MQEADQPFNRTPRATPRHPLPDKHDNCFSATPLPRFQTTTTPGTISNQGPEGVLYGTNISILDTRRRIQDFFLNFTEPIREEEETIERRVYCVQLQEINLGVKTLFEVDGGHLSNYDKSLYVQMIYYPVEMISIFDEVIQTFFEKRYIDSEGDKKVKEQKMAVKAQLRVEITNLSAADHYKLKQLGVGQLGRLISLQGIVVRMSQIIPEMKVAVFECDYCKEVTKVRLENASIDHPQRCIFCKRKQCLSIIHNLCQFTNKQYIKFQELLQNVSDGQSPSSVKVIAYDNHVDQIRPGDAVQMIAIYRTNPVKICHSKNGFYQVFQTYFDLISLSVIEKKGHMITEKLQLTEKQKRFFIKMADSPTIIQDLVDSFAPSIFGNNQVKKGLLCQLLGGTKKERSYGGNYRSEINVLLIGDPSTAKSQMLQQTLRIAPRCVYTSGRGSSAQGLTVSVSKDPQTRQYVLESGALVLGDKGICCLDQFDKMKEQTRTALLQAMQQQTISIAKAGIVCSLNARTAILAAANPIDSKYNSKKALIQNINLPPTILSRFDLIFLMLDVVDREIDRRKAEHILNYYSSNTQRKHNSKYSSQQLYRFISFAKDTNPILSQEAGDRLVQEYKKMRQVGISMKNLTATPRLLQAMIRLSESFAKMKLSNVVVEQDVEEAVQLINDATLSAVTDPETGMVDMGMLVTGRTSVMRQNAENLSIKIKEMMLANRERYSKAVSPEELEEHLKKINLQENFTREELTEALNILKANELIYILERGKVKLQQCSDI